MLLAALPAHASAQSAQAAHGGEPQTLDESRWSIVDTAASGGIRHATLGDLLEEDGIRYLWLRISRPPEENNSFLFFARMGFDCRRRRVAMFRNFGFKDGEDLGGYRAAGWDGQPDPTQRRLLERVCALPAPPRVEAQPPR